MNIVKTSCKKTQISLDVDCIEKLIEDQLRQNGDIDAVMGENDRFYISFQYNEAGQLIGAKVLEEINTNSLEQHNE